MPADAAAMHQEIEILMEERAITRLIQNYCRIVDEQRYKDWFAQFTQDGIYSAINVENLRDQGMTLFTDRGMNALMERASFWLGLWQVDRNKMTHLVSNIMVDTLDADSANVNSRFVIYRTDRDGLTQLYATGEYNDRLAKEDGIWKFRCRQAIIDWGLLPSSFSDPL